MTQINQTNKKPSFVTVVLAGTGMAVAGLTGAVAVNHNPGVIPELHKCTDGISDLGRSILNPLTGSPSIPDIELELASSIKTVNSTFEGELRKLESDCKFHREDLEKLGIFIPEDSNEFRRSFSMQRPLKDHNGGIKVNFLSQTTAVQALLKTPVSIPSKANSDLRFIVQILEHIDRLESGREKLDPKKLDPRELMKQLLELKLPELPIQSRIRYIAAEAQDIMNEWDKSNGTSPEDRSRLIQEGFAKYFKNQNKLN